MTQWRDNPQSAQYNGLPDDLKSYKAPYDPFQIVEPDMAIFLIIVGGFCGYVFRSLLA